MRMENMIAKILCYSANEILPLKKIDAKFKLKNKLLCNNLVIKNFILYNIGL